MYGRGRPMKPLVVLVVLASALGVVGTAASKGPDRARVCGSTCRWITGDQQVYPLLDGWWSTRFVQADAPRAAPYFTFAIDSTQGESGSWLLVWVPSKRLMRVTQTAVPPYELETVGPYWRTAPPAARSAFAAATRGLRPHRAVRGWRIGSKRRPTWASLRRPLHLPPLAAGAPCPVSPQREVVLGAGDSWPLPGPGPAYPVLGPGTVLSFFWPVTPEQGGFYGSGWSGNKVMWIVAARYRGRVLVRGRQLDGPHLVRFGGGRPPAGELRISTASTGAANGVRRIPSFTRVEAAGCYTYQIDGTTFSRTIVFEARSVPPPP